MIGSLGLVTSAPAQQVVVRGDVLLPSVAPIPQSAGGRAFDAAEHSSVAQNLAAEGYVEEEYLLRGTGRIFSHPAVGTLQEIGRGPYTTRILVRRPTDPARFNGAIVIEPLNPSTMADLDLMWMLSREEFMRKGYIWVGMTYKPVALESLKTFDPQRYAALSLANPLTGSQRCIDREVRPGAANDEAGFVFDMLSQLGALVRTPGAANPISEFRASRVYLAGFSQTAGIARAYSAAIAPFATRAGGARIFDGYVFGGHGPFSNPFSNCEKPYWIGDARLDVRPAGVPVIDVLVEGDLPTGRYLAQPDGNRAPNLYRHYEIAGATHSGALFRRWGPQDADFQRSGRPRSNNGDPDCVPTNTERSAFPLDQPFNAIWRNLDAWVLHGVSPPPGTLLSLTGPALNRYDPAAYPPPVRDAHGNAVGGTRTVAVDVPLRKWHGARGGADRCLRLGYSEPLSPATLTKLYASQGSYLSAVTAAADRLVKERWLTPEDRDAEIEQARKEAPLVTDGLNERQSSVTID